MKSPVKVKEVSVSKVINKETTRDSKDSKQNSDAIMGAPEMDGVVTGLAEKKKRVYNNMSRRQVSHLPWITLMEDTKVRSYRVRLPKMIL